MNTVLHAVVGYLFLILVLRVIVRRPGSQQFASDFVLIFLMGGVIIPSTMGDNRSVTNAFSALITIGSCHRGMSYLKMRYPKLGEIVDGTPLLLLQNGQWQMDVMRKAHVTDTDVMAAARTKGMKRFDQIKYAVLERNGGISVIEKD